MTDKNKLKVSLLNDRYEIKGVLGEGGLGVVYAAFDRILQIDVAIKTLQTDSEGQALVRLQREAVTAGRLQNENIAKIFDFGQTQDGMPYMVMELVVGKSLAELISESGPFEFRKAVNVFIQICRGLENAHKHGIVHRDLKPSNVMLIERDETFLVKLLDFGVAKLETDQKLTTTGAMVGSPVYMSPEQARGLEVTYKSDFYSLGCLMFETLTGQPPFKGESALDTISMHRNIAAPLLTDILPENQIPSALVQLIDECLHKSPDDRPEDACAIKTTLENILTIKAVPQAELFDEPKKIDAAQAKSLTEQSAKTQKAALKFAGVISVFSLIILSLLYFNFHSTNISKNSKLDDSLRGNTSAHMSQDLESFHSKSLNFEFSTFHGDGLMTAKSEATDEDMKDLQTDLFQILKLKSCNVTGKGFKYLQNKPITEIEIRTDSFQPVYLKELLPITTLKRLRIDKSIVDDKTIQEIIKFKNLEGLSIDSKKVTDETLSYLSALPKLKMLKLECKKITDKSVLYLAKIPGLTELEFEKCPLLTENLGEKIPKLRKLERLELPCNQSVRSFKAMARTNITDLKVSGLEFDADEFNALCEMNKLKKLRMSNTMVSDPSCYQNLLKLKNLKKIELKREEYFAPILIQTIVKMPLEDIDFHDSKINNNILPLFLNCPALSVINLKGCKNISQEAADDFQQAYFKKHNKEIALDYDTSVTESLQKLKINPSGVDVPR